MVLVVEVVVYMNGELSSNNFAFIFGSQPKQSLMVSKRIIGDISCNIYFCLLMSAVIHYKIVKYLSIEYRILKSIKNDVP